jgi:hypothetical protein
VIGLDMGMSKKYCGNRKGNNSQSNDRLEHPMDHPGEEDASSPEKAGGNRAASRWENFGHFSMGDLTDHEKIWHFIPLKEWNVGTPGIVKSM